ncbi:DUF4167 domain-containing protein [Pelagibacteraceae bacterium]|nr:DUF4167 domain-containing protein [Pelagibacteraceae bacterium]
MTNFVRRPRGRGNPRSNGRRPGSNFRNNGSSQVISINDNGNSNGSFQRQRNNNNRHGGNAFKLVEKYKTLANDALASGDRILAENYFQHADHFVRLLPEQKTPVISEKNETEIEAESGETTEESEELEVQNIDLNSDKEPVESSAKQEI